MSLRDLVAGSDMCTPSDGAGPSNALGSLVNTLLGGAGKTQEQLRELPGAGRSGAGPSTSYGPLPSAAEMALAGGAGMQVPGLGPQQMDRAAAAESFMRGIHGPGAGMAGPPPAEWDAIFAGQGKLGGPMHMPPTALHPPPGMPPGAAPPMLAPHFQAFMRGAAASAGPRPAPMPLPPDLAAQLSVADKVRIRDRSTIMARHLYAEQGDRFADAQVDQLLASLRINPRELPAQLQHVHGHGAEWHEAWKAGAAGPRVMHHRPSVAEELAAGGAAAAQWETAWDQRHGPPGPQGAMHRTPSTGWAAEFANRAPPGAWAAEFANRPPPGSWAAEFANRPPPGTWAAEFAAGGGPATADPATAWASDFKQEQEQQAAAHDAAQQAATRGSGDTQATTAALADVLSKSADPKMRNSKFLQFVSKMSKGELLFEDNKVVERSPAAASWANEFASRQGAEQAAGPQGWANEFTMAQGAARQAGPQGDWVDEFAKGVSDLRLGEGLGRGEVEELEAAWRAEEAAAWAQEFNKMPEGEAEEWERLYGQQAAHTALGGDAGALGERAGEYVFAASNPFVGDAEAGAKGKDLFRRGVLSEAVLALEAEVRARPDNAEAWRLLGTVQAENDDDRQAIAAMMNAHRADPRDPDVLLSLSVSHTNELAAGEAVRHLRSWLATQPAHAELERSAGEAPDSSQRLTHVIKLFEAAAAQSPSDPELHVALGVLHHLGRNYPAAISAFESALQLRPNDYSLWNKLGATLANFSRSREALAAYQKALDLKPNYVRAWTNMGISYANLGDYDRSAAFYVRALGLNPAAQHVWGYLRTSLACGGKMELMRRVDEQDLPGLQAALPLE